MFDKVLNEKIQGTALKKEFKNAGNKKMYIESYGCQMNFSDSEIVASVLSREGFRTTKTLEEADLVLINTCSIRDKAEQTVRNRLKYFQSVKKKYNKKMTVGVLGCMAERLKEKLLDQEKLVDIVVGPDAYRDLPKLVKEIEDGKKGINVFLSLEETYADISPIRLSGNGVTAFVSITRGCDNMCTFCVVPYTRGRERSRDPKSIIKECEELIKLGYKEVTLLGQNVDSYLWYGGGAKKDFKNTTVDQKKVWNFAKLLDEVAKINPVLRIRFSTSNPQDMTDQVIDIISKHKNICDYIHLPVQSGSSKILKLMNRGYSRNEYLNLIKKIKNKIPDCAISMDMIAGFCNETEKDHLETLSLMDIVKYDYGYMFKYSERPNTPAAKKFNDNVHEKIKQRRLTEIISKQREHSLMHMKKRIGKTYKVLIEGISKKSNEFYYGRTTHNATVVFEKGEKKVGDYVNVKIKDCTSATLIGDII